MSENAEIRFHVRPDTWLPIEQLLGMFHPMNSQVRDEREMVALQQSILDEGFTAEIIVINSWNGKIVSGHGRTQACFSLGYRGELPVIFKEYPSEEAHRLTMLRWNRARGHQNPEKERAEVVALAAEYERSTIAAALAYTDEQVADMLREQSRAAEKPAPEIPVDNQPEAWPVIRLRLAPETWQRYQALLDRTQGADEGEKLGRLLQCVNAAMLPVGLAGSHEFDGALGDDLWDGEIDGDDAWG